MVAAFGRRSAGAEEGSLEWTAMRSTTLWPLSPTRSSIASKMIAHAVRLGRKRADRDAGLGRRQAARRRRRARRVDRAEAVAASAEEPRSGDVRERREAVADFGRVGVDARDLPRSSSLQGRGRASALLRRNPPETRPPRRFGDRRLGRGVLILGRGPVLRCARVERIAQAASGVVERRSPSTSARIAQEGLPRRPLDLRRVAPQARGRARPRSRRQPVADTALRAGRPGGRPQRGLASERRAPLASSLVDQRRRAFAEVARKLRRSLRRADRRRSQTLRLDRLDTVSSPVALIRPTRSSAWASSAPRIASERRQRSLSPRRRPGRVTACAASARRIDVRPSPCSRIAETCAGARGIDAADERLGLPRRPSRLRSRRPRRVVRRRGRPVTGKVATVALAGRGNAAHDVVRNGQRARLVAASAARVEPRRHGCAL